MATKTNKPGSAGTTRRIAVTAILIAIAEILQVLEFAIPIIPSFVKLDFSELPALIASFAYGPAWGIAVCFVKNLIHVFFGSSMAVGELSNFILGAVFVGVAGLIYKKKKDKVGALIGSLAGAGAMAVFSLFSNYYVVYPIYAKIMAPMENILAAYRQILPFADTLWKDLLIFNLPFTFAKGLIDALICFAIYKKISPILKKGL